jgi:hypothetical protein
MAKGQKLCCRRKQTVGKRMGGKGEAPTGGLPCTFAQTVFLNTLHLQDIANAARLEERHLAAEIDQRREFQREKRNSQTRIKYMERYCDTPSPPSPQLEADFPNPMQPVRRITDRQKQQLEQEYLDHKSMDQLHEAKIKVLRDRQERQLQEAISRMEKELQSLIDQNTTATADLERRHRQEEQRLLDTFKAKETKLIRRWNLEEAIIRKKLELRDGQPYGPLPPLSLTNLDTDNLSFG